VIPIKQIGLAVIGDEDLVNGLRLAGVDRYFVISGGQNVDEEVRDALTGLLDKPGVGIVVIQEDYVGYVDDLITQAKQGGRTTTVIVEVPSKYGTKYQDVNEFYKAYIRKFIGFDVAI